MSWTSTSWATLLVLSGMDNYFLVDEIWLAVRAMLADEAPDPDRFTCLFYQTAWLVIKDDVMHAFSVFWLLDFMSFYLVNQVDNILL
jgi:hypothetical protein